MSIKLSPKYGFNPSIAVCFYCGKEKNELVLAGRLKGDVEAPRHAVWNKEPCDECKEWMKQGIIFIEVYSDTPQDNPPRAGGWAVIKEEAMRRIVTPKLADEIAKQRVVFVPTEVWKKLGIATISSGSFSSGEQDGQSNP